MISPMYRIHYNGLTDSDNQRNVVYSENLTSMCSWASNVELYAWLYISDRRIGSQTLKGLPARKDLRGGHMYIPHPWP